MRILRRDDRSWGGPGIGADGAMTVVELAKLMGVSNQEVRDMAEFSIDADHHKGQKRFNIVPYLGDDGEDEERIYARWGHAKSGAEATLLE